MDNILKDAVKMEYMKLFQNDILEGKLSNLQKLFDASHITNNALVELVDHHFAPMTDITNAIFCDIAYLLAKELVEDDELVAVFDGLYYKQYKDIFDGIQAASNAISIDYNHGMKLLGDLILKVVGKENVDKLRPNYAAIMKTSRFRMLSLLHMRNKELVEAGTLSEDVILESYMNWQKRETSTNELYLNDDNIVFSQDNEPVFKSNMYKKFVERQLEALASYLCIRPDQIANYFEKELCYDIRKEDFTYLVSPNECGVANMAAIHVVQSNYGGSMWLHSITAPNKIRKGSFGYKPDFEKIVDNYYRARVLAKYPDIVNSGAEFTKSTLSRECKAENPRDDFFALMYLYNTDIIYQMFKVMQKEYYRNFSWENIAGKNALSRANQIVQDMKETVSKKEKTIIDLTRRLDVANNANSKVIDAAVVNELKEQKKLLDVIEEKEKEIEELKQKLRLQEELINAFSSEDQDDQTYEKLDMEGLQQKRYLFVGHTEEDFPELNHELRKNFPDSIFMRSETDNIDKISVDAVVVFLNWTSHGMYYKVKATGCLKTIPYVYCKSKNIDKIYQEMQNAII